ncbi:DNA polymerase sliding clamp [Halorubrum aidingense JCM 13560]|uniref:DNA polymerase sliding clamp n=2 Tax=Halorubrum aidingense TaxID=368623 RepID=M0PFK2_9EURY|nr:DNA polymerase sliding clamp [Halorubrum aidingense JCM 13560]
MTVIVRAEVLQQVIDQMLTVVDEAIFRIGYDGLAVAAVDPANVGMVELEVEPGAFESVGDGMFPIGLNLQRLDDYIDGASGADPVTLSYQPETRSISIEHTNVEVEMAGIDPDAIRDEPDIPDLDHSVDFTVNAGVFRDSVENAELVSDHVEFEAAVDDKELVVSGNGDTDKIETVLGPDELPEANFDSDATSMYSLAYLVGGSKKGTKYKGLLKPLSADTDLQVEFSEEHPIQMHYEFADGFGHVTVLLAPRIQKR